MSKVSSSRRKSIDGTTRRGRPRQIRLAAPPPPPKPNIDTEITRSDIEKIKQVISEQEFESQIAAQSPLSDNLLEKNSEVIELQKKILELQESNLALEKKNKLLEESNSILKSELDNQGDNFVKKLQEKTEQAKKLLDEKIDFYEKKKNEEVANIRLSVFEDVASSFLEPIILLQSIINSSPSDPVVANYLQGFKMLLNQFEEKLNDLGVDEINVNVGDPFNELYMEAFDVVENSDYPPNTVVKVVKKGFVVNETKVLKHTLVVVSK